jgi:hypothetical protein
MATQYRLQNINANSVLNNGTQQISIQPYKEVTSLNVNQLLTDIVSSGASQCQVEFSTPTNPRTLRTTVKAGFTAYFLDKVSEVVDEEVENRSYVVKITFETDAFYDADMSFILPGAGIPTEIFRNYDRGSSLGSSSPTHRRIFLVLRYSWEEGMLGASSDVGGGSEGGAVGKWARLTLTPLSPFQEYQTDYARFSKTIYLGELLNLGQAIQFVDSDYVFIPSLITFRPQPFGHEMKDVFKNLKEANANFKIDINPTGDYIYVGPGKAFLSSSFINIPPGFTQRVRVVTPSSNIETDPSLQAFVEDSEIQYSSSPSPGLAGQPILNGNPIPAPSGTPNPNDIKGQYDG